jgi:hypothetical protein
MTRSIQRILIAGLIAMGILLAGFFGLRTLHAFKQFRGHRPPPLNITEMDQAETDVELIRDWMTIPFIAKTYHVPPQVLFDALEIPPGKNKEKSLKQVNQEYYPQAEGIVITKIKAVILEYQSQGLPALPTLPSPDPPIQPIGPIAP